MPTITQTQGGQSSAVINGQSVEYITQQLLQQCSSCPDSLAASVLTNVLREFYLKSTAWREVIGPYTIQQGSNIIELNPVDQYSECKYVLDAFVWPDFTNSSRPRRLTPLLRQPFGNGLTTNPAPPYSYFMDGPSRMMLYPNADKAYGNILYVYMSLTPVLNTPQLPNIAITDHFDGLFYGALHRLCSMPNKPWTVKDKETLNEWRRRFRQEIMLARDIASRSFSTADAAFAFPQFAGRYSQSPWHAAGPGF